ncbi:hypothetical protein M9Y10_020485 [Tritrichomonas musculus]|uniref:Surface antigen BspA-like n=1 Tax=Tritrichomonas musculus TaxID=1915356 RepID=A0ABR2HH90_9EUKA
MREHNEEGEKQSAKAQIVIHEGFKYTLNTEAKTASLIGSQLYKNDILIPYSINYNSQEYIVVNISDQFVNDSSIKSIRFQSNSEIQIFNDHFLSFSLIESIMIPSNLTEIAEGCFESTPKLNEFTIDSKNQIFSSYKNDFILKKSTPKSDEFDVLIFARRNIERAIIPSFVKQIAPFAFMNCTVLDTVEIPSNSKLQIIGKFSFSFASFVKISLPSQLTQICEGAFSECYNLTKVEFPKDCELKKIGKNVFSNSQIESITIPSHVTEIVEDTFNFCLYLKSIDFQTNSEIYSIHENAFNESNIESISIPSSLKELKKGWCKRTQHLDRFTIDPSNKNYKSFEGDLILGKSTPESDEFDVLVFARRKIKRAIIPSCVKQIASYAFMECYDLNYIEIPKNSQLQIIDELSFYDTKIEELFIPSSLIELKDGWCQSTQSLIKFTVDPNNKHFISYENDFILGKSSQNSDVFDVLVFARRNIETVVIPSFIKRIAQYAFQYCKKIKHIEIPIESKLEIIDKYAFYFSSVKNISIPSSVKQICERSFCFCFNLKKVKIPKNSQLFTIDECAFLNSSIESITIPSGLTSIGDSAFCDCGNLANFELPADSKLQVIGNCAFSNSSIVSFTIPVQLIEIRCLFSFCSRLEKVFIPMNSHLKSIDKESFAMTSIKSFYMPPHITKMEDFFDGYNSLQIIELPENSELQEFDKNVSENSTQEVLFMIPVRLANIFI